MQDVVNNTNYTNLKPSTKSVGSWKCLITFLIDLFYALATGTFLVNILGKYESVVFDSYIECGGSGKI